MHLEHYHQRRRTYYEAIQHRLGYSSYFHKPPALLPFSTPDDKDGYNAIPISNDLITDAYQEFCKRTRQAESEKYLKILTGMLHSPTGTLGNPHAASALSIAIVISMDATFKVAKKAAVVSPEKAHEILMKGGILSMMNELNEIIAWVRTLFTQKTLPISYRTLPAFLSVSVDYRDHGVA